MNSNGFHISAVTFVAMSGDSSLRIPADSDRNYIISLACL